MSETTRRIDEVLKHRGMSRREVAIAANIPTSTFQSAMERGKNITIEMVSAISRVLNVSPFSLMGFDYASEELEKHINNNEKMMELFSCLNSAGQQRAIERIEELLEVPKYRYEAEVGEGEA